MAPRRPARLLQRRPILLADGTQIRVRPDIARIVVGVDADRNPVASSDGLLYPLTPCCHASGKGSVNSPTGVCCRACYAPVDPYFGGVVDVVVHVEFVHADADGSPRCGADSTMVSWHGPSITCPACLTMLGGNGPNSPRR